LLWAYLNEIVISTGFILIHHRRETGKVEGMTIIG